MKAKEEQKEKQSHFHWLKYLLLFFIFMIGIFLYSNKIATHGLKVKERKIINANITEEFHGLKIVHFSDVHYNDTTTEKDLHKIQSKINELNPDIVVFTGDLFSENASLEEKDIQVLTNFLTGISANIGKYAITGEDDYSIDNYPIILENSGFMNLDEKYDMIYNKNNESILIAGLSTNLHGTKNAKDKLQPTIDYLNSLKKEKDAKLPTYKILLLHEPDFIDQIDYQNFDLVLAGHTHLGQVKLPLIGGLLKQEGSFQYRKEYYQLGSTDFYISSGIGTAKYPFRLFNRPSIQFYRITNR